MKSFLLWTMLACQASRISLLQKTLIQSSVPASVSRSNLTGIFWLRVKLTVISDCSDEKCLGQRAHSQTPGAATKQTQRSLVQEDAESEGSESRRGFCRTGSADVVSSATGRSLAKWNARVHEEEGSCPGRSRERISSLHGLHERHFRRLLASGKWCQSFDLVAGSKSLILTIILPWPIFVQGAKQRSYDQVMRRGKSYRAVRKVRNFEEDFDPRTFVDEAQQIYIDAHKCLSE